MIRSIFSSVGPLYVLLGKMSVQVVCPFFNWIVCLPGVESYEFFIHFASQILVQCIIGKYILPYGWFPFHFDDIFFSHAEDFKFDIVPICLFFLLFLLP